MISTPIVYLHSIELDVAATELESCWRMLDRDEQARADRFRFPQLRSRWIKARAGLKEILSHYCSSPPEQLRFDCEKHGKPVLAQPTGMPDLHFNLSHAHNLALVAVTRLAPIGVDHEYQRPLADWQAVAQHCFSPCEYRELMMVPKTQRQEAFYRCWTRKEAVIKATGEGFSAHLKSFDVSCAPGQPAEVRSDTLPDRSDSRWQLEHLDLADGYVGALAVRSSGDVAIERRTWLDCTGHG